MWIEFLKSLHEDYSLVPDRVRALDDELLSSLVSAGILAIVTVIDRESGVPV